VPTPSDLRRGTSPTSHSLSNSLPSDEIGRSPRLQCPVRVVHLPATAPNEQVRSAASERLTKNKLCGFSLQCIEFRVVGRSPQLRSIPRLHRTGSRFLARVDLQIATKRLLLLRQQRRRAGRGRPKRRRSHMQPKKADLWRPFCLLLFVQSAFACAVQLTQ
jgi:hypothetical protein